MSPDRFENLDPRMKERLSAYLDDELSPEEAREVLAWIESDPAALRDAEELRRVWDLLKHYRDEEVPEGFSEGVLARIAALRSASPREGGVPAGGPEERRSLWAVLKGGTPRLRFAAAAAILVAAGLGAVVTARVVTPTSPDGVPSVALESMRAEAIENLSSLASLSDEEFEAVLAGDPEDLAQPLESQGG